MWGTEDKPAILPKTKGSGIMVSDFIYEHNGFLRLSSEELEGARKQIVNFYKRRGNYLSMVRQGRDIGLERIHETNQNSMQVS